MPDTKKKGCDRYGDLKNESIETRFYAKTACQLEVMGMNTDGVTPLQDFMPNLVVTRAQLATTLSRLLFGRKYDNGKPYWYSQHIDALRKYSLLKNTNFQIQETRGNLILIIKRAYDSDLIREFRLSSAAKGGISILNGNDLSMLSLPHRP